MRTLRVSFICGLVLMMCASALAQSVQTDYDRSFNLAGLKTYAFHQPDRKPGDPLTASPLNNRRIHDALDAQLKVNGFTDSANPDFVIAYYVTTRQGFDIQDNRFGILQRAGSVNVNPVTEGTIVVIFMDSSMEREVWRGTISGEISPKNLDKDVNKGIAKLVKKFVKDQAGKK